MKGEIRSGLISPVVAAGAGKVFEALEKRLINEIVIKPELARQLEQESYRVMISGVSAGDPIEPEEQPQLAEKTNTEEQPENVPELQYEETKEQEQLLIQAQEEVALFDPEGGEKIGKVVSIGDDMGKAFTPKTVEEIGQSLYNDFINPKNIGNKYHILLNPNPARLGIVALATMGELSEYAGENIIYGVSRIPGGKYVLEAMGSIIGTGLEAVHSTIRKGAKLVLDEQQVNSLVKEYQGLPHGIKVLGKDAANVSILGVAGKVGKIAIKGSIGDKIGEKVISNNLIKNTELSQNQYFVDVAIKDIIGKAPIHKGSLRELAALEFKYLLKENGKVIAGAGHLDPIKDINRLVATYGGKVEDWAKMKSRDIKKAPFFEEGYKKEIHWYENIKTGEKVDFKVKRNLIKHK